MFLEAVRDCVQINGKFAGKFDLAALTIINNKFVKKKPFIAS